jgi:ribulose bisphosphate carboxylase small subunit
MSINKIMRGYDYYKNLYESIKPIRGRSEEVKPLGKRTRDWEQVVKAVNPIQGADEIYSAKLYQTECVRYHPNGDIELRGEQWSTPITASFIHEHSPFYCYKQYKKLWVRIQGSGEDRHYPIPEEGLTMRYVGAGGVGGYEYEPTTPVVIEKEVVDRTKAKDARAPLKPFLDWAKMIHKLSDGWIMDSTREQFGVRKLDRWNGGYEYNDMPDIADKNWHGGHVFDCKKTYAYLQECSSDDYMKIYLALLSDRSSATQQVMAKSVQHPNHSNSTIEFYDMQFDFALLKRKVYKMAEEACDIKKTIEVEVGGKPMTGVK